MIESVREKRRDLLRKNAKRRTTRLDWSAKQTGAGDQEREERAKRRRARARRKMKKGRVQWGEEEEQ